MPAIIASAMLRKPRLASPDAPPAPDRALSSVLACEAKLSVAAEASCILDWKSETSAVICAVRVASGILPPASQPVDKASHGRNGLRLSASLQPLGVCDPQARRIALIGVHRPT